LRERIDDDEVDEKASILLHSAIVDNFNSMAFTQYKFIFIIACAKVLQSVQRVILIMFSTICEAQRLGAAITNFHK